MSRVGRFWQKPTWSVGFRQERPGRGRRLARQRSRGVRAASRARPSALRFFVKVGFDLDARNRRGIPAPTLTPPDKADHNGRTAVAEYLRQSLSR